VPWTERVRLFTDVADLPLGPAAMLAKAAASLDVMSGRRFELGIGAGCGPYRRRATIRTRAVPAAPPNTAARINQLTTSGIAQKSCG
jgi:alkanesulfonate monooxygenase SsuD/methylene tetrahydromethanopterin reductase-like flavin-dependent oxidoreductase (luciferase family)